VAQRLHEIAPSLVAKQAQPAGARLEPRKDRLKPFTPLQIETNSMLAVLTGAIQQLSERVRQLEART
jgi:hypothetical protein